MKEAIRNYIIEKARDIFENNGFQRATIEEIAKAASISVPTFYNYFEGKKGIFMEVIKSIELQIDGEVSPIFQKDISFLNKFDQFFETLLHFVFKNKRIVKIAFFDPEVFGDVYRSGTSGELFKIREKRISNLSMIFEEGQAQGVVTDKITPHILSLFILGIFHDIFFEMVLTEKISDPVKVKQDIMELLTAGIIIKSNEEERV